LGLLTDQQSLELAQLLHQPVDGLEQGRARGTTGWGGLGGNVGD
jgi:hypothetical protein